MPKTRVLEQYCKGCSLCVEVCPQHALVMSVTMNRKGLCVAEVREGTKCTGCMNCVVICPDAALELDK